MNETDPAAIVNLPVVRDPNFVRLSMDLAYFKFLGHDIEAALMVQTTDIDAIVAGKGIESTARLGEIARVRMSPAAAIGMLQNLSMILIHHELTDVDDLTAHIENAAEIAKAVSKHKPHGGVDE